MTSFKRTVSVRRAERRVAAVEGITVGVLSTQHVIITCMSKICAAGRMNSVCVAHVCCPIYAIVTRARTRGGRSSALVCNSDKNARFFSQTKIICRSSRLSSFSSGIHSVRIDLCPRNTEFKHHSVGVNTSCIGAHAIRHLAVAQRIFSGSLYIRIISKNSCVFICVGIRADLLSIFQGMLKLQLAVFPPRILIVYTFCRFAGIHNLEISILASGTVQIERVVINRKRHNRGTVKVSAVALYGILKPNGNLVYVILFTQRCAGVTITYRAGITALGIFGVTVAVKVRADVVLVKPYTVHTVRGGRFLAEPMHIFRTVFYVVVGKNLIRILLIILKAVITRSAIVGELHPCRFVKVTVNINTITGDILVVIGKLLVIFAQTGVSIDHLLGNGFGCVGPGFGKIHVGIIAFRVNTGIIETLAIFFGRHKVRQVYICLLFYLFAQNVRKEHLEFENLNSAFHGLGNRSLFIIPICKGFGLGRAVGRAAVSEDLNAENAVTAVRKNDLGRIMIFFLNVIINPNGKVRNVFFVLRFRRIPFNYTIDKFIVIV